jgi:hypothetical protein
MDSMNEELIKRAPRFHQFVTASVSNPSHARNVHKKQSALIPPMCDAACQIISVFSEDMNATRRLKSVLFKKADLKKVGFKQLSALNICMGYNSTSKMFENFGVDFDMKLKTWKHNVEEDSKKEKDLLSKLQSAVQADNTTDIVNTEAELVKHRNEMHPGYSFTGDNVDILCKPRQMTKKNQNKDHHMFQFVGYKNRISSNHLPNDKPTMKVQDISLTTFLPNAAEQRMLVDELVILVGNKWAEYIPALWWFKEHIPDRIVHEYMQVTKLKTEKVRYITRHLM